MKRIILNSVMIVIAALLFGACSSGLSITKRKYNKGYFVQHHSRKSVKPAPDAENRKEIARQEPAEKVYVYAQPADQHPVHGNVDQKQKPLTAAAAAPLAKKKSEAAAQRAAVVELAVKNPFKAVNKAIRLSESRDAGDDALSLLWVVIVIILIVYLLGLLFDGFGLGGLIHILAVIAIVLLILWLLKIL